MEEIQSETWAESKSALLKEGAANNAFTRFLYKGTSKVAKSSFDARAGSVTGAITGSLGDLGKAKDGGYRKALSDNEKAKLEFSKEIGKQTYNEQKEIDTTEERKKEINDNKDTFEKKGKREIEEKGKLELKTLNEGSEGSEYKKDLEEEKKMNQRLSEIKEELEHNKSMGALETNPYKRAEYQNKIESLKIEGDVITKTKQPIAQRLSAFDDKIKEINDRTKNTIETKQKEFDQQLNQADNKIKIIRDQGKTRQLNYSKQLEKPRLLNFYRPFSSLQRSGIKYKKRT